MPETQTPSLTTVTELIEEAAIALANRMARDFGGTMHGYITVARRVYWRRVHMDCRAMLREVAYAW